MKAVCLMLAMVPALYGQAGKQRPPSDPQNPPLPTGVEADKLGDKKYIVNGKPATREDAYEAIETGGVDDVSHKRRITIVGSADDCNKALALLPKGTDKWAIVKQYRPDDWHVINSKFVSTGSPSVTVQDAEGGVIHRQDNLDDLQTAIGKTNPAYDPRTDPDLRRGLLSGVNIGSMQTIAIIVAVTVLLTLFGPMAVRYVWTKTIAARSARLQAIENATAQQAAFNKELADAMKQLQNGLLVMSNTIKDKKPASGV